MTAPRRPPPGILGYVYRRAGAIYFSATDPRPFRNEDMSPVEWCTPVSSCAAWVGEQQGPPADWAAAEAAGRWVGKRPAAKEAAAGDGPDFTAIAFEAWWRRSGEFARAGGGDYEKCFAWGAWQACLEIPCECEAKAAQP